MVCVVEYGDNIGTLKNFFKDTKQAFCFVQKIIGRARIPYRPVGQNQWYCPEKKEYVRVEHP